MAHKPIGVGLSFATSGTSAQSGIIPQYSNTLRLVSVTGDAHVKVGTNPTATTADYYIPAGGTATLGIGRPSSQKIVGVTTGTTTIVDFPEGSGCPFEVGDRVEITGISPSGINTNSVVIASIDRTSATLNADYAGKVRMTLTWNTASQGAVTDSEGEVRKVVKVAALGSGGSLYAQQVQISGDA